ncbi:MAG: SDR family oxidoreductase [Pseudomonadota bacterium]
MPTLLITGANRGIGLELARQYAAEGWRVHATCRAPEKAQDLKALAGTVSVHRLDVTAEDAVRALAAHLEEEAIDLLINNAGVLAPQQDLMHLGLDIWRHELAVNSLAPFAIARAFLPQLRRGAGKTIANLTSRMGSIADNTSGGYYAYRSSKAALNAVMKSMAIDLARDGIKVCLLHPGWVQTAMGGPQALIDAQESATALRRIIARLTLKDSGRFFSHTGEELPW